MHDRRMRLHGDVKIGARGLGPPTNPDEILDPIAVAWAAGIFEGEGSLSLASTGRPLRDGSRRRTPRMQIGMTDLDVLEKFHKAVGLRGTIMGPYDRGANKPIYHWAASARLGRRSCGDTAPTYVRATAGKNGGAVR